MNGIVIVDKPQGWTSQDVTARLRRVFSTRRIGHGGTLDPMATGVLPVFVGRATRGVEFFEHAEKTYETVLRLGLTTDTEDVTGTVLTETMPSISREELEKTLEFFRGDILQVPPMYSALKVNGQKLCDLARKGQEVERKPRSVTIYALELLEQEGPADFRIRCLCSKGTYIRTLCHDIGAALGCGGTMSALRRTMAAGFTVAEAVTLEEVQSRGAELLLPTDSLFSQHPILLLKSEGLEKRVRCGNPITLPGTADGTYRIYSRDGQFLCLSQAAGGQLTSLKNFFGA